MCLGQMITYRANYYCVLGEIIKFSNQLSFHWTNGGQKFTCLDEYSTCPGQQAKHYYHTGFTKFTDG